MTLCENCIHWQGGKGVQKGVSLCREKNPLRYTYPAKLGDPHGYAPVNKSCFRRTPTKLTRKPRVRVKKLAQKTSRK